MRTVLESKMHNFKALEVRYNNIDESHVFIVEQHITADQVRSGDPSGIVCQVFEMERIDSLLSCLNDTEDRHGETKTDT